MGKSAEIRIGVELSDQSLPERIYWSADDAPFDGTKNCDALLLSIWDPEERNTLSIDLWTSDLTVSEMGFFVLQTLLKLAQTVEKATQNRELCESLRACADRITNELEKGAGKEPVESPKAHFQTHNNDIDQS